jgi:hypothetical protein
MPAKKDSDPAVATFMQCVMEAIGVTTVNDLIDRLAAQGLLQGSPSHIASELRKAHKWKKGESGPSFRSTMMLARGAGFLSPRALACLDGEDSKEEPR